MTSQASTGASSHLNRGMGRAGHLLGRGRDGIRRLWARRWGKALVDRAGRPATLATPVAERTLVRVCFLDSPRAVKSPRWITL